MSPSRAPASSPTPGVGPAGQGVDPDHAVTARGLVPALGAYTLWGLFPLYIASLAHVGAWEVVAHRATWSFVLCGVLVLALGRGRELRAALHRPGTAARLVVAAALLSVNWLGYVHAVQTHRTLDAALAYYLNPLLTVLLGVLVLGERLRRAQWVAVALGACAVTVLGLSGTATPWLALTIALSWAFYGLTKKRVGAQVTPLAGMTIETAVILPAALGLLLYLHRLGNGHFLAPADPGTPGTATTAVLLLLAGVVTTAPLLLFATASRHLPLVVIGLLQFATPTMQFLVAVLAFGEPMPPARWLGFAIVWAAMVVLALDIVATTRRRPGR